MKTAFMMIVFIICLNAQADDWLCSSQASVRRGNEILACGKGKNKADAFRMAQAEFNRVCDLSSDCRGHEVIVTPKRMEKTSAHHYIRLLAFEIQPTLDPNAPPPSFEATQPMPVAQIDCTADWVQIDAKALAWCMMN